ncbi:MAG: mechanosensitive ion channel family protein [Ectothiorhodospiraceae bacterium]|jgi:small-conductance mechanosensitive channel
MESIGSQVTALLAVVPWWGLVRAAVILAAGTVLGRLVAGGISRALAEQLDGHQRMLARRIAFYVILGIAVASALHQLGFQLGVLLGAAGVFSVAIAFAAQTSASNLISGLFLVAERPFSVGDVIRVGSTTGEVLSIDLLSVKLRAFDNTFVRIPNETIVKSEVATLTRFPIRRVDLQLGVAYREDIDRVREVLMEVADREPLCLEEPPPLFIFTAFGESSIDMQFSVWALRENFLEVKNRIQLAIKRRFDEEGIEIPFPHRSLYAGSMTDPFPVKIVAEPEAE